jgi:hypothetical protein
MSSPAPAPASDSLARLRALLCEQGGLMATLVESSADGQREPSEQHSSPGAGPSPAALAASGPRAEGRREQYELLVEAIYEGYLLHYGAPRALHVPEADMRLLAGDRLYAIGLAHLVQLADTFAVAELADTITLSALAQGAGAAALADAVWMAGARTVGWGPSDAHSRAKDLVLTGAPAAIEAMRTSAGDASAPR